MTEEADYTERVALVMFHDGVTRRHAASRVAHRVGVPVEEVLAALPPEPEPGVTIHNQPDTRSTRDLVALSADQRTTLVIVLDAYLSLSREIEKLPGTVALADHARREIAEIREVLRATL